MVSYDKVGVASPKMRKFCSFAFFLWLFGGLLGLHHFYLGRDKHGFLWATTFGGFFIGWIKEFSSLATYTEEANVGYPRRAGRKPLLWSKLHRLVGFVLFGLFYRMLVINAIPNDIQYYRYFLVLLGPIGVAFGTYMVSNVGHIRCPLPYPLIGAYFGELLFGQTHILMEESNSLLAVSTSGIGCLIGWRERQRRVNMKCHHRFLLWTGLGLLIIALWCCYGYHNAEVYVEDLGQNVKLREIISKFLNSPEWAELRHLIIELGVTLWDTGGDFEGAWSLFQQDVAISRVLSSLQVLGFNRTVNIEEEITEGILKEHYRKLVRVWHPDKLPPDKKEEAQTKFIEINEAYETVVKYLKRKKTFSQ